MTPQNRYLAYRDAKGLMHMVEARTDSLGQATPTAKTSVCGGQATSGMTLFNGLSYDDRTMREAACLFGEGFCGKCVASLYGGDQLAERCRTSPTKE